MEPSNIQIVSEDDLITIYKDGEFVMNFSVDTEGYINFFVGNEDDHWWLESPDLREGPPIPLNTEYAHIKSELKTTTAEPLSDRDQVLSLIRRSYRENPSQTKAETALVTKQIARKVYGQASRRNVMRVAGYRAAVSRGVYDDKE